MPLILGTNSIKDTGYEVANSLRFNSGSSDYLNRNQGTQTENYKYTFSAWVKRSGVLGSSSVNEVLLGSFTSFTDTGYIRFEDQNDNLQVFDKYGSTIDLNYQTDMKFRDPSSFYHIVVNVDSTRSANQRCKIYVNGSQVSCSNTTDTGGTLGMKTSTDMRVGAINNSTGASEYYFDGYMAEVYFIDGTGLDASNFGEFDSDSPNIWKPKAYEGSFGNNGFYLDFENSSSLGADVSGNGNNFTVNNLTSVDQSTDTCTNNFATWNPLHPGVTRFNNCVFADGNLEFESNETGYVVYPIAKSTIGVSSGKWYAEFKLLEANAMMGISDGISNENYIGGSTSNGVAYQTDGQKRIANSQTSYGDSYTANDIIGVAMDLDNNRVFFSKNGTFQNSGDPTSSTGALTIPSSSTGVFHFATLDTSSSGTSKVTANFGSPAFSISSGNSDGNGHGNFEYSVPSGYLALCTKNLSRSG